MSYDTEFSAEYKRMLKTVEEYFTVTLIDRVKLCIRLGTNLGWPKYDLESVGFSTNEAQILLTACTFSERPRLRLKKYSVDFCSMSFEVEFVISDIVIYADFDIISRLLGTTFKVPKGDIRFSFKNIYLKGRLGFFVEEDSFRPINLDMHYSIENMETEIRKLEDKLEYVKVAGDSFMSTLTDLFTVEIRDRVDIFLASLVAECVIDHAVSELIGDQPEHLLLLEYAPAARRRFYVRNPNKLYMVPLRQYEEKRVRIGLGVFNEYIAKLVEVFKENGELLRGGELHVNLQKHRHKICTVTSPSGRIQKFDTLRVRKHVSYFENDDEIVYYGFVEFSGLEYIFTDCEIDFDDRIRLVRQRRNGDVAVDIQATRMHMRVILPKKEEAKRRVEIEFANFNEVQFNKDASTVAIDIPNWLPLYLQPYLLGHSRYYTKANLQKTVEILNAKLSRDEGY